MDARRASTGALEIAEKTFEPGPPSITRSQSNLAMVLKDLGQMKEARDLLRKALAWVDSPRHPSGSGRDWPASYAGLSTPDLAGTTDQE
jgi:hypothetical protein